MKLIRLLAIVIGIVVTPGAIDGAGSSHRDSEANYFRVMTFNIRYDEPRDKENAWSNRKELVASVIRFHHADLVGVQEALRRQLDDLSKLLPEYGWVGVGRADGKNGGEFSAILYRTARFKVATSGTFWLSETPNVRGSKGWDSAYPRIVTWAQFNDQKTGRTLFHFNTHFDHRGEHARLESARLLRQQIAKIAGASATVVTGDFNFDEASEGYRLLTAQENKSGATLRDSRYLSRHGHHGPTSTFNEFKALIPSRKIDFILVKEGIEVLQHGVLSDTWDGRFPSDHLPVLAEVLLN